MSTFMTTCPIPFNTTQKSGIPPLSPPSEDALTKRSQVIKNKKKNSSVKNFMAVPPTPPDEPITVSQKRTVSFQLPPEVLGTPVNYDTSEELYLPLSPSSPPPELECIELSKDILVPLMERDKDMRELVNKNKAFFDTIKSCFGSEEKWQAFNKILNIPRAEMCDNLWMDSLTEYLRHNPALLQKFKYIVGYFENGYNDDETEYSLSWSQNEYTDITPIRDYAEKLHRFEDSYPQFFVKARECLSQEKRSVLKREEECNMEYDLFSEFKEILFADRSVLDDDDWEMQVYDCLDNWPDLATELEHIIAYEAQDSDVENDTESSDDDEEYFYTS